MESNGTAGRAWSSGGSVVLSAGALLLLVVAGACQPAVCEESYPYWRKLLHGVPIPMVLAMVTSVGIFAAGDALLQYHQRRSLVLPALAMSCLCLMPFVMDAMDLPSDLMLGTWCVLALAVSAWGLPPLRAWAEAGWLRRICTALLVPVLLVLMLIFTVVAGYLVIRAGQINCRPG